MVTNKPAGSPASPARLEPRVGAQLIDSALALLVFYLSIQPMGFAADHGFVDLYILFCQSFIIGWVVLKDAWWPGQSLGKRVARIRIVELPTNHPATRARCVARQAIFAALLTLIVVPFHLASLATIDSFALAIISTVTTAGAPIRILHLLALVVQRPFISLALAQWLVAALILVEAFLVYVRPDRRRIIDLLSGVMVVSAK